MIILDFLKEFKKAHDTKESLESREIAHDLNQLIVDAATKFQQIENGTNKSILPLNNDAIIEVRCMRQ